MSQRAKELAQRFTGFNNKVIALVENCSDEDWRTQCGGENWTVGVAARHIGASHYGALNLAKMIVAGEPLPDLSQETVDQMNAQHAQKHAECTKEEALGVLRKKGSAVADFVAGLSDADLDQTGHLPVVGGDITTQQFIENIIIQSGGEHLASMQAAVGD